MRDCVKTLTMELMGFIARYLWSVREGGTSRMIPGFIIN